jgi:hypothetical protein
LICLPLLLLLPPPPLLLPLLLPRQRQKQQHSGGTAHRHPRARVVSKTKEHITGHQKAAPRKSASTAATTATGDSAGAVGRGASM